jgi:hypothetical protein
MKAHLPFVDSTSLVMGPCLAYLLDPNMPIHDSRHPQINSRLEVKSEHIFERASFPCYKVPESFAHFAQTLRTKRISVPEPVPEEKFIQQMILQHKTTIEVISTSHG